MRKVVNRREREREKRVTLREEEGIDEGIGGGCIG